MSVNVVQCRRSDGKRIAAIVDYTRLRVVGGYSTLYEIVQDAIHAAKPLEEVLRSWVSDDWLDYNAVYSGESEWTLLPPVDHTFDNGRCLISGTGLSHRKSADNRHAMHASSAGDSALTDSMRMYQAGVEGGRPAPGEIGAPSEWFWKGDGRILCGHGAPLTVPNYAEDGGDEAEIAGIYIIGKGGAVYRIGLAAANEFSDHLMESRSYLCLAPSKLRQCSLGPEIVIGGVFDDVSGEAAVVRSGTVVWSQEIKTGEANMVHSLANLEHHHFKYDQHRRVGDVHVHCFGTPGFSFGSGIRLQDGDVMSVRFDGFGRGLSNPIQFDRSPQQPVQVHTL